MDALKYPQETQQLIADVVETRSYDQNEVMRKCRNLVQIGKKENDAYLLAVAYFYLAEGYYVENKQQECLQYLIKSMGFQNQTGQWNLMARSYNLLAQIAELEGNIAGALDYCLSALSCSREHNLLYEERLVYSTIGELYEKQREYKAARYYYQKYRDDLEIIKQDPFGIQNLLQIYLLEGRCCLHLNDLEGAKKSREKIEGYKDELFQTDSGMLSYLCFNARYAHITGNFRKRDECIELSLQRIRQCVFVNSYEDLFDLLRLLFETEKYDILGQVFPLLHICIEPVQIAYIRRQFIKFETKYYEKINDREKYLECCSKLFELEEAQEKEVLAGNRRTIEWRFNIEEMRNREGLK